MAQKYLFLIEGIFLVVFLFSVGYFVKKAIVKLKKKFLSPEKSFEEIFKKSQYLKIIVDTNDDKIILANTAAMDKFASAQYELIGKCFTDILIPKDSIRYNYYKSQGWSFEGEIWQMKHLHLKEMEFYAELFSSPVQYQGISCIIITLSDITDKVKSERAKENIQKAIDNSVLNSVINRQGAIESFNKKFQVFFDLNNDAALDGHKISYLLDIKEEDILEMYSNLTCGKSYFKEAKVKKNGVDDKWLSVFASPVIGEHSEIQKLLLIMFDISKRKKLEIEQQQLLDDVSLYAYQTAHKMRAPLARLMGLIDLLDHNAADIHEIKPLIKKSSLELDGVFHEMIKTLNRSYKL